MQNRCDLNVVKLRQVINTGTFLPSFRTAEWWRLDSSTKDVGIKLAPRARSRRGVLCDNKSGCSANAVSPCLIDSTWGGVAKSLPSPLQAIALHSYQPYRSRHRFRSVGTACIIHCDVIYISTRTDTIDITTDTTDVTRLTLYSAAHINRFAAVLDVVN